MVLNKLLIVIFIFSYGYNFGQDVEVINDEIKVIQKGDFNFYIDTVNNEIICLSLDENNKVNMISLFLNRDYESIYSDLSANIYPFGTYFFIKKRKIERLVIHNISDNYFIIDSGKKNDNLYFLRSENEMLGLFIMCSKKKVEKIVIGNGNNGR